MVRELIIDGYNLLHAAGLARASYGAGDLDRCRKRMLIRLADLIDEGHRSSITIVFDAKEPPHDVPDRGLFQSMLVRYAVDHAEADDLIEELIRINSTPRRLLVVSGDQRLRQAARRKGAHSVTGEEFLDALEAEARDHVSRSPAARREPEMDDVTQELSEIDIDALLLEIESERPDVRVLPPTETSPPALTETTDIPPGDGGSHHPEKDSPRNVTCADEVSFWNARIAELLREEGRAD